MKKILLLSIAMFALGLDAYVVSGLLPGIGHAFHVSASAVGQMVAVFTLCYALSAPICATLLAGRSVRQILLLAMAVFIIANAATALVTSFAQLLLVRAIAGAAAGLFSPTAAAAAVALAPPEKKGRALGFILGGMGVGTVIGVPLGLLLAEHTQWQNVFLLVSLLGLVAAVGIYWKFPSFKAKSTPSLRSRMHMLVNPKVTETIAITVMVSIASLGLYTYLAPIIHSTIGVQSIAPYLWAWGVGGIVGSFSIGSLIDVTGQPKRLLVAILFIMGVSMLVLPHALVSNIVGFIPFFLWGATGWSSQAPQQHALLSIEPEHGAIVVALNSSANYLGSAIGAGLGGLALGFGVLPNFLPYIAGAIALTACAGQIILSRRRRC
jgi:predicted MFS family arabinose efflux permease